MSEEAKEPVVSKEKKPLAKTKYKALVGLNYGDKRVEADEVVDDIPADSVEWLLEGRYIEKVK